MFNVLHCAKNGLSVFYSKMSLLYCICIISCATVETNFREKYCFVLFSTESKVVWCFLPMVTIANRKSIVASDMYLRSIVASDMSFRQDQSELALYLLVLLSILILLFFRQILLTLFYFNFEIKFLFRFLLPYFQSRN